MTWQKPQGCDTNTCVEVDTETTPGAVLVRTTGTWSVSASIAPTHDEWRAFIAAAKAGQYDLPEPGVTFAEILPELLAGATVARRGWVASAYLARSYHAFTIYPGSSLDRWQPTMHDLGADDWYVAKAAP